MSVLQVIISKPEIMTKPGFSIELRRLHYDN